MEIKKTLDYSLFKKLDGNRDIKKRNVLVKSIEELDLTKYSPIIVSEDFRIVDGQHRFDACQQLGKPIYFVVMPSEFAERAMILFNRHQSQWRTEEFLNFKETKEGSCYTELKEFMGRHKITLSYAAILFPRKEFDTRRIKNDNFTFEKGENAEELALFWNSEEFKTLYFRGKKSFVRALRMFYEESTPKQRAKLLQKASAIPEMATHSQFLTVFRNYVKMRK